MTADFSHYWESADFIFGRKLRYGARRKEVTGRQDVDDR